MEEDAAPAEIRDRGVGGGAGGSWRGLIGMVESSVEESASKLSLRPRENGIVSTGRSAVSPEMLEVGNFLHTLMIPNRKTNELTGMKLQDISRNTTFQQIYTVCL